MIAKWGMHHGTAGGRQTKRNGVAVRKAWVARMYAILILILVFSLLPTVKFTLTGIATVHTLRHILRQEGSIAMQGMQIGEQGGRGPKWIGVAKNKALLVWMMW